MPPVPLENYIVVAYVLVLSLLGVYGLHRLAHLRKFRWKSGEAPADRATGPVTSEATPAHFVTVQLPLYNERTVAARLIRAAGALRWPRDRFELQVLDDSTDETAAIVDAEVEELRRAGIDAVVVRRPHSLGRIGFKAGALEYGMQRAKGELFCIFDADFLPHADFLERLVPLFDGPGRENCDVGMVQARWEHLNREDNSLTRAQSTLLDGHFVIEHTVRHTSGWLFNFNGTAGIWRKQAILDAGGWQHDTLTEDLDLSYRAQLEGWRFVYAPDVVAPAEVPPTIAAFKSQQHRWAKGSVQVARKLLGRILRSDLPLRSKLEAVAHLTGNGGYPLILLLALLLPPSLAAQEHLSGAAHLALFVLCTLSVVLFYERGQRALGRRLSDRLRDVPAAMSLGIGLCVSQTRAVLEGLRSDPGVFLRTPKRGDTPAGGSYRNVFRGLPGLELVLAAWLGWGLVSAVRLGLWGALPFLLLFFVGFAWVGALTLREWLGDALAARRAPAAGQQA